MERIMHMDDKKKRTLGILSFVPLLTFLIFAIYFLIISRPLIENGTLFSDHDALSSIMSEHYTTLTILSGLAFVTGVAMLAYYVIHIARLTHMEPGTKIAWMMFLVVFMGIGFPFYWYYEIRNEPENMRVYPDYA